jgi:hypothetical protein
MWKNRQIPAKDIVQAAEHMRLLIASQGGSLGGDRDEEVSLSVAADRLAANVALALLVIEYVCVPRYARVFQTTRKQDPKRKTNILK